MSEKAKKVFLEDAPADQETELRCPACGYTLEDSRFHGDHRLCKMFPFFSHEKENATTRCKD
jgi:hypothetical protein